MAWRSKNLKGQIANFINDLHEKVWFESFSIKINVPHFDGLTKDQWLKDPDHHLFYHYDT